MVPLYYFEMTIESLEHGGFVAVGIAHDTIGIVEEHGGGAHGSSHDNSLRSSRSCQEIVLSFLEIVFV